MRRIIAGCGLAAGLSAALGGCQTPAHSNVLIFGTDTKLALDVAFNTSTTTPSITLGYKRNEGVWMPLVPNTVNAAGEYVPQACTGSVEQCAFQGRHYNTGLGKDTYSVLASFGANISTGASAEVRPGGNPNQRLGEGQTEATVTGLDQDASADVGVGIAQYFATGLAAQILAHEGGARLVSVQAANALEASADGIERQRRIDSIVEWASPGGGFNATCWQAAVNAASLPASVRTNMLTASSGAEATNSMYGRTDAEQQSLLAHARQNACPAS